MLTLNRLLLAASMCCLVATANAAPIDDAIDAQVRGDYVQALNILRPLAAQGDAWAPTFIGNMYRDGQGVTQNYQEALKWWRLAADQGTEGTAVAQYNIGELYHNGKGVAKNYQEALKWFRLAAAQGSAAAQASIGVMYYRGQGVTQDHKEAGKWFRLAAEQGYAEAQVIIGVMYDKGQGVTQDYASAHMWYNLASSAGQADGAKNRDIIAKKMTPQQVEKAQDMARACQARNFKGCR